MPTPPVDLVEILAAAIGQLPTEWAAGHGLGDEPDLAQHGLLIRADSAGASHWFTEEIRARNAQFSIGHPIDHRVRDALAWSKKSTGQMGIAQRDPAQRRAEQLGYEDREMPAIFSVAAGTPMARKAW